MKKLLTFLIIFTMFAGCAVPETPLKERSAKKRQKEIQRDLRERFRA